MTSHFETIARHFAGKTGTNVIFEAKTTPQTDGKNIILPKYLNDDCLIPTLAALLHESSHIKMTKMDVIENEINYRNNQKSNKHAGSGKIYGMLCNLAEDIRIDTRVFQIYPNSFNIYTRLIEMVFRKRITGKSKVTEKFLVITQHIYLYALGFESYYYNKDEFEKFLVKNRAELDGVVKDIKSAKTTSGIKKPVEKLIELLKNYIEKEDADNIKQDIQHCVDDKKQQSKDLEEQISDLREEAEDFDNQRIEKQKDIDKLESKRWNDKKKTSKEMKEIEEELDKAEDEMKGSNRKASAKHNKANKLEEKQNEIKQEAKKMEEILDNDDFELEEIFDSEVGDKEADTYLNGFSGLEESAKQLIKKEELIDFEDNMKAIFNRLQRKEVLSNNTGKLNLKKIHKIFNPREDDYSDLFVYNKIQDEYNNKIMFLLDASGSMGRNSESHKNSILLECVTNMIRIIDQNKDLYNIDYSVGLFSDYFRQIKSFEETITEENLMSRYRRHFQGGSTNILEALADAQKILEEGSQVKDKKFIIIFTDAEFTDYDCKKILDEYASKQEKIVFIGIDSEQHHNERFFKEILMERLVKNTKDMERVLIESFDRMI